LPIEPRPYAFYTHADPSDIEEKLETKLTERKRYANSVDCFDAVNATLRPLKFVLISKNNTIK